MTLYLQDGVVAGSRDGLVAGKMNQDDTRKYELAKAPVKRLLLEGIKRQSPYRRPKVSEGLLLTFREQVEDYALDLAERIGAANGEDRVTSKLIDLDMANNLSDKPLPPKNVEEKPQKPKEVDITDPDVILRAWALELHRMRTLIDDQLDMAAINQKFHDKPLPSELVDSMEKFIVEVQDILPELNGKYRENARILEHNMERFGKRLEMNEELLTKCGCGD